MTELHRFSARSLVTMLDSMELTPIDILNALEMRISDIDHRVNALPTLCFERAYDQAHQLMKKPLDDRGILRGLPLPIKDLTAVAGVRCTFGSRLYERFVPDESDIVVRRLEQNGGIVYAKSNTPEFGAGGNTFNDVFGATRNPYNLNLTAGGSSGGAAAALASGTAWLAQGSDLAGSLRTPASFCGIASLRPSPGLIANGPSPMPFQVQPQEGPMARDVADLALLTDAMLGESALAGLGKPIPVSGFRNAVAKPRRPLRVAFSEGLGIAEPATAIKTAFHQAISTLEQNGLSLAPDHPDLGAADLAFDVPRALDYASSLEQELDNNADLLKPELIWNAEYGLSLDGATIRSAMLAQGEVFNNAAAFMQNYDLLICPAVIVEPFPVEERYPGYSEGLAYSEYYRWLAIAYAVTTTTLPVITIPCGKTAAGLPLGLQLIGKPHGDLDLFSFAAEIEAMLEWDASPVDL